MTPSPRVFVVEPEAGGRVSGGYLYNLRLAESRVIARRPAAPGGLEGALEAIGAAPGDTVLLDSLLLEPRAAALLAALGRASGARVGALVHAFPSFVRRASEPRPFTGELRPTAAELEALAALDIVVTPGAYVARVLAAAGCHLPCLVCPPGVDRPATSPRARPPGDAVRLVTLANLTPNKGIPASIRALSPLRRHAFRLTVVGAAPSAEDLADLVAEVEASGLADHVRFAGPLAHADALARLAESDVTLLSSYTENAPLAVLEALAAGVPVVAYAAGGVPDLVEHERSGLLVPLSDEAALSAALERVLTSAPERARLAAGAREAGAKLPSWDDAAAAFQRALGA